MAGADYEVEMEQRRSLPPGGTIEHWPMADGWPVRLARWEGARGTILFANGRGNFIEIFAEAIWDWTERGWGVIAFDWRGQGGSGRLGRTPLHGHASDFAPWVADLVTLVGLAAELPGPLVGVGHSTGGHLWLRALAEGEVRVARVALVSPMLGIARGNAAARALTAVMVRLGFGGTFALGQHARLSAAKEELRAAALTSDAARQTDEAWWLASAPELALGGGTWGWLHAAFGSIAGLHRNGALEAITIPVHAELAGEERVTDTRAAIRAVVRPRGATYVVNDGERHELLREADVTRTVVLGRIAAFLEQA